MQIVPLFVSILVAQCAGFVGSFFTASSVTTWYQTLQKPSFNPPGWIFGPVWITLYTLMGTAAYLIWRQQDAPGAKMALYVYGVHLVLNAAWSILFFGLKNPGLAFAEILVLLFSIGIVTILFWKIDARAGMLLLPYLAWVTFASILNFTIWQLN